MVIDNRVSRQGENFWSNIHNTRWFSKTHWLMLAMEGADNERNRLLLVKHIYVRRKAWIWTIHGLRCAKHGSALCATINGLPSLALQCQTSEGQSMDCCAKCRSMLCAVRSVHWIVQMHALHLTYTHIHNTRPFNIQLTSWCGGNEAGRQGEKQLTSGYNM